MSETLGHTLESARRKLGRSLADAEADTRIRAKLLEALEKGEYEALPSAAYVKGYLISYAKFLGLEPQPLIELYERETGQASRPEPVRLPEPVVSPRAHSQQLPFRTAAVLLGLLALVAAIVWGVSGAFRGPEAPPPIPPAPETTSSVEPSEPETPAPGVTDEEPVPDDPEESVAEPFALLIEIEPGSASWLRVTVDGLTAYEGTMAGGQRQEWQVAEEASLRIGRPSAVTVFRDGQQVEIPPGDPPTLVLSTRE